MYTTSISSDSFCYIKVSVVRQGWVIRRLTSLQRSCSEICPVVQVSFSINRKQLILHETVEVTSLDVFKAGQATVNIHEARTHIFQR